MRREHRHDRRRYKTTNSLNALEKSNKFASSLEESSNDPSLDQGLQNQFPAEYQEPLEISDLLISRAILRVLSDAASGSTPLMLRRLLKLPSGTRLLRQGGTDSPSVQRARRRIPPDRYSVSSRRGVGGPQDMETSSVLYPSPSPVRLQARIFCLGCCGLSDALVWESSSLQQAFCCSVPGYVKSLPPCPP